MTVRGQQGRDTWAPPAQAAIFVSSTFRDMQLERDAIHDRVLPLLREFASAYGTDVSVVDLRWGVDTSVVDEAEQERKVIHSCLSEIDRCAPFFVSLVGERYGYVPDASSVAGLARTNPLLPLDRSMTELEILHALQVRNRRATPLHLLRTISNQGGLPDGLRSTFVSVGADARRQANLRRTLARRFPNDTRTYDVTVSGEGTYDLTDFCNLLYNELKRRLASAWGPPPEHHVDSWTLERALQRRAAEEAATGFSARERELGLVLDFCDAGPEEASALLLVRGEAGAGTTTLLSRAALDAERAHPDACVAYLRCGLTPRTSTRTGALRHLAGVLYDRAHLNQSFTSFNSLLRPRRTGDPDGYAAEFRRLHTVLLAAASKQDVLVFIDDVDRTPGRPEKDVLSWLPNLPDRRCRVVCASHGPAVPPSFDRLGGRALDLAALDLGQAAGLVRTIAAREHKELTDAVVSLIANRASRSEHAMTPLAISLTVQGLLNLGQEDFARADAIAATGVPSGEALAQVLLESAKKLPDRADELFLSLALQASEAMGPDGETMLRAIMYLAITSGGLRVEDLARLPFDQPFSIADFSWFRGLLGDAFVQRGAERWDFAHETFRQMLRETLDENRETSDSLSRILAAHFLSLLKEHPDDPVARDEALPLMWRAGLYRHAAVAVCSIDTTAARDALLLALASEGPATPQDSLLYQTLDAAGSMGTRAAERTCDLILPTVLDSLYALHAPSFAREVVRPLCDALADAPDDVGACAHRVSLLTFLSTHEPDEEQSVALLTEASHSIQASTDPLMLAAARDVEREWARRFSALGAHEEAAGSGEHAIRCARLLLERPDATMQTLMDAIETYAEECDRRLAAGDRKSLTGLILDILQLMSRLRTPAQSQRDLYLMLSLGASSLVTTYDATGDAEDALRWARYLVQNVTGFVDEDTTTPLPDRILRGLSLSLRLLAGSEEEGVPFLREWGGGIQRLLADSRVLGAPLWTPGYDLSGLEHVVKLPWDAVERAARLRISELRLQSDKDVGARDLAFSLVRLLRCRIARGDEAGAQQVWAQLYHALGCLVEQEPTCTWYSLAIELSLENEERLRGLPAHGAACADLLAIVLLAANALENGTLGADDEGADELLSTLHRAEPIVLAALHRTPS